MQKRFSYGRLLLLILIVAGLVGGTLFAAGVFKGDENPTQPGNQPTAIPNQPIVPGQQPGVNPTVAPVNPGQPAQPGQPVVGYPVLCQPGTDKTPLTTYFDSYVGFYALLYRVMAMPARDHYCIILMPKWSGPNFDQNGFSEAEMEAKLRSGEADIYFASNGALALWDANSGVVVWSSDQSSGADVIIARDSVSTTGHPNFNDALGRTVLTSKGSADHYFLLKAFQAVGFLPGDVNIQFTDSPVKDFMTGQGEFVTYWDPVIRDAMVPGNTVIITTKDWRTISDYVVVSRQADAGKQDALVYFLADYNIATEAFTADHLQETAKLLVTFRFNGQDMADWLWMDVNDPYGSLNSLLDGVAIATLNDNVNMFEQDLTGWSLIKDQFDKTHATWQYGGVFDNADGTKGSLYDAKVFISNKYVDILKKGGAKSVSGIFNNDYITDINQELPDVDENTLFTLPELLTLKYKNIQFVEGQARMLIPGELDKLMALVQPIANLMAESPDAVIVLQGGHGYFSTNPDVMENQRKFAFRRALYIRDVLSDMMGIPIARIVIDPNVIAPDHVLTDAELPNFMVVLIKVINTGGLR